ncbi:hypothetical protein CVT25_008492 [Psilocybe cyanescens]|uniref:Uncharacterized protein n=1 Tax=Psilocybe cyanescens TaxID=93625 RepID=A0A409XRY7_PSICY|nr:hypothetical protein CVT25_008492 [Psilocybe cyanescens]
MTLAQEAQDPDTHPYAYGCMLKIFHVDVKHKGALSRTGMSHRMDVLWIRWFENDESYAAGWNVRWLDCISFVNASLPGTFGFLDPTEVICATHLIAAFAHGLTSHLLQGKSIARLDTEYNPENKHEN